MSNEKNISNSFLWKLLERFGVQGSQFILQIILARLLDPAHYGVLSIMIVFTTLANVFIQGGLNTALIQNKDVDEDDYSTVFWVSLTLAGVLYAVIFFTAPLIGAFYEMPDLVSPLRVLALMLFPGAFNSVQLAKVSREMQFRKIFVSNVGAIVVSGGVGIAIALLGGGLWALVAQSMLNVFVACVIMRFTVRLRLRLFCNFKRLRVLFAFGWKLLVSNLIDTLYQDIRSLVIGKKYDSATLGYYNRGKQFPQLIINSINSAVQSVMLPAMSSEQDDREKVKAMMRNSITLSAYVIFPMMAGLAGVATPLVRLLLTDKWLPCVPYMQIYCFILAFYPVHSCNLQAINAMGRSDIFLKLELIKKSMGLVMLVIAVFCFDSPIVIALSGVITTLINCFVNAYPNKKLIGYSYFEQMRDILPSLAASLLMLCAVLVVGLLPLHSAIVLVLQIITGGAVYVAVSVISKMSSFMTILTMVKRMLNRKKRS
ncbi:MAG: lipopolysaccharide biosynthesis protein [Clostridia bacterium]|nr:lipopolysaccharide biosynthesis protein [Clostridia bacterium]